MRLTQQESSDWYATFCGLAGVDPFDARAQERGLPPVDSLDLWPVISGSEKISPRKDFPMTPFGEDVGTRARHGGDAAYMSEGRYKLFVGNVSQAGWCGEVHPNVSRPWDSFATVLNCGVSSGKVRIL